MAPRWLPGDPAQRSVPGADTVRLIWEALTSGEIREDAEIMQQSNTLEGYRDQEDPLLFVMRQPHEIRPPSDAGVKYTVAEDGTVVYNLDSPTWRPEYEIGVLKVHTEHTLCLACIDCLNYMSTYAKARSKVRASQKA